MDDKEIRLECLRMARELSGISNHPREIGECAEFFWGFIKYGIISDDEPPAPECK